MKNGEKKMKELLKTTDVFKVDTEDEAIKLIENYREKQMEEHYTLTKSGYALKTKKSKGEIVDSWVIVTVESTFAE